MEKGVMEDDSSRCILVQELTEGDFEAGRGACARRCRQSALES